MKFFFFCLNPILPVVIESKENPETRENASETIIRVVLVTAIKIEVQKQNQEQLLE